ncbi:hypothetical protein MMC19_001375 [Ptychographa xylographoides]|nr:hypothetical protein [Ptychographa xylographoides]
MACAQTGSIPRKRKSEANDYPARRPRIYCNTPSVEQWLTAISPVAEPNQSRKRTRSECETTGTRKKQRFDSDTRSLQLTKATLHHLEATTSISPTPESFMGSQSERSISSNRTDSLSAYDARFIDELERRNIYFADHQDVPQPQNLDEILELVDKREENAPHLELQARNYRKILDTSGNEADVMQSLVPKVLPVEAIRLSDNECTVANQQWGRHVLHRSELRPLLAAPKPDQAFGFKARCFPFYRALALLRQTAFPAPQSSSQLLAPYFVVEAKGEQGSRLVAKRQSLWAAVTMLSILTRIATAAGTIDTDFFDRVHVMSAELTTETIQLSCYWATRREGQISYWGKTIRCWSPNDPTGESFQAAYHGIHNAVQWTRQHVEHRLYNDLELLEQSFPRETPSQMTPPDSDHRSRSRKRKPTSNVERAGRSASSLRTSFSA